MTLEQAANLLQQHHGSNHHLCSPVRMLARTGSAPRFACGCGLIFSLIYPSGIVDSDGRTWVDGNLVASPNRGPVLKRDLTLRELQTQLPWTVHYSRDFRANPMPHKDFGHALLHVQKAAGKLASVVNDAEHGGSEFKPDEVDRYIADLVVCALRMANTCPGRTVDLQRAVEDRIETKNSAELRREPQ